jgi:hypothetical protein
MATEIYQTSITSLHVIKRLVFLMEANCVLCEIQMQFVHDADSF